MSEAKNSVKDDITTFGALDGLSRTAGGKILIRTLKQDLIGAIDGLCSGYKTLPDIELRALCARLGERLSIYRTLTRAKQNHKLALAELERLLEEDPDLEREEE